MLIIIITIVAILCMISALARLISLEQKQTKFERENEYKLFSFLVGKIRANQKIRKMLICFCVAVIIFCMVVCVSYIPNRIQSKMGGIELFIDEMGKVDILQHVEIKVAIRLHNGMFSRRPRVYGFIEIDAYEFTHNRKIDVHFRDDANRFANGQLRYPFYEDISINPLQMITFGDIYTNEKFTPLVIWLVEDYDNLPRNRMIIAPANDLESAKLVMQGFCLHWTGAIIL